MIDKKKLDALHDAMQGSQHVISLLDDFLKEINRPNIVEVLSPHVTNDQRNYYAGASNQGSATVAWLSDLRGNDYKHRLEYAVQSSEEESTA